MQAIFIFVHMRFYNLTLLLLGFILLAFAYWPGTPSMPKLDNPTYLAHTQELPNLDPHTYTCQLNNRLVEYMDRSVKQGIRPVANTNGLRRAYRANKLVLVKANVGFQLDTFQYSYAFLTPYAHQVLKEIGRAFKDSLANTPLADCDLIATSMTRTQHTVKKLVRKNRTAVNRSPHLNGNAFDFSFSRFAAKQPISESQKQFLQTTISKILLHFKKNIKIWVTFERQEECLHVVARKGI